MLIIFLYKCNQTLKICFLENRDIILRQVIKLVNKQTTQRLEMTQLIVRSCMRVSASVIRSRKKRMARTSCMLLMLSGL